MRHPLDQKLFWTDAGLVDYATGIALQDFFHQQCKAGKIQGTFIKLEHHPVVTLGKHASMEHLLLSPEAFAKQDVKVFPTDRGGEVTAHMPGQLVVYPVLNIGAFNFTPKKYIAFLLNSVCAALQKFGVTAAASSEFPGVWLNKEKICAIGVRFKERVSLHGIAVNVCNDLQLFKTIVPCGLSDLGVTSLSKVCGKPVSVSAFWATLLQEFTERLGPISPTETLSDNHFHH